MSRFFSFVVFLFLFSKVLREAHWKYSSYNDLYNMDRIAIIRIVPWVSTLERRYIHKREYHCE